MRKGDAKKQEILTVSEELFCRQGYQETSVQDILDILGTSKGSFYHHFESKGQVLEVLCANRAVKAAEETEKQMPGIIGTMDRVNAVLSGFIPLKRSQKDFMVMLLPQLFRQEGRTVCSAYQDALTKAFEEPLRRELDRAIREGLLFPPGGDNQADIVMALLNRCWVTAGGILLESSDSEDRSVPGRLLDELKRYRQILERLLNAPYGSIELIDLEEWLALREAVSRKK